jgi:Uri superfamily endonuclease
MGGRGDDSGVYRLWIEIRGPATVTVGRLGTLRIEAGTYIYVGSARRNLSARLDRHRQKNKPMRWHIDYVLALPGAAIRRIDTKGWSDGAECRWARQTRREGGRVVIPGFGAGDCHGRCGAHLFMMSFGRVKRRRA